MKTVKLCNVHGMLGVRKETKSLELAKMMNGLIVVQVSPSYGESMKLLCKKYSKEIFHVMGYSRN